MREFQLAVRRLRRHATFATTAALTLAIGLAVSGTMFAVLDSIVHPPPPFPAANELYTVSFMDHDQHGLIVPPGLLRSLIRGAPHVAGVAVETWEQPRLLETAVEQRSIDLARIHAEYFGVFGVRPVFGRFFSAADSPAGNETSIVVSEGLWRAACQPAAASRDCVLRVNRSFFHVIGVAPQSFARVVAAEAWIVRRAHASIDSMESVRAYVRVRPGTTRRELVADLQTIGGRLVGAPDVRPMISQAALPFAVQVDSGASGTIAPHVLLTIAAALVLLLVCANLTSLAVLRAKRRRAELALRASFGATRLQLAATLLGEWVMIIGAGAAVGYLLTMWSIAIIDSRMPGILQVLFQQPRLSNRVFAFECVLAVVSMIVIGGTPALLLSRVDLAGLLTGLSGAIVGRGRQSYKWFVIGEIALSVATVAAAGVILSSLTSAIAAPGSPVLDALFYTTLNTPQNVIRAPIGRRRPPSSAESDSAVQYYAGVMTDDERMLSAVAVLPGIRNAGLRLRTHVPHGLIWTGDRSIAQSTYQLVSSGLLPAIGAQPLTGRLFTRSDRPTGRTAVVDQRLADRMAHGQRVVGMRITLGARTPADSQVTIIGVVTSLALEPSDPHAHDEGALYVLSADVASPGTQLFARFAADRGDIPSAIGAALRRVAAAAHFMPVHRFSDDIKVFRERQRFLALVVAACGALGLLLASIGLYGVVNNALVDRARELALRRALGASGRTIVANALRDAFAMLVLGACAGALLAGLVDRIMRTSLYGVNGMPYFALVAAEAIACGVTILCCLAPAIRVVRIDPVVILRASGSG